MLKLIKIDPDYIQDCVDIKEAMLDLGYDVTLVEAYTIWSDYSRDMDAGWLGLPPDPTNGDAETARDKSIRKDLEGWLDNPRNKYNIIHVDSL